MLFAETASSSLQFGTIVMGLLGGLALFLFGMEQMSSALKQVAGDGMKKLLATLTTNRFTGAIAGALVTAIIQSSSVTTVLVVGFVSAELMTLTQSIGIIMGANIGTTITAQIIAFKVTKYALAMIALGFAASFCFKNEKVRQYGNMTMGLGLIFFGMHLMSDAASPLRDYGPFMDLMAKMENPLYAVIVAAAFTAIVQSSSATTGLVIALAMKGTVSLEAGIALVLGANIGTCITAMLACIGKPREAVRVAMVHVVFNIAGVALWIAFVPQLAALATSISPTSTQLLGAAQLAADTPRQIANAHTVFNIANTLIFIWCAAPLAWLVRRMVPDNARPQTRLAATPRYLDELLLQTPSLALETVRMEMGRLGSAVLEMARESLHTVIEGSQRELDALEKKDDEVDHLHAAIVTYLGKLSRENLTDSQSFQIHDALAAANYIENLGDMVETNLVEAGRERLKKSLTISESTQDLLERFHDKVCWAIDQSVAAFVTGDTDLAIKAMDAKNEIHALSSKAEEHLSLRLAVDEPNRLAMFRLESELVEYLKRVYYFAKRIAKLVTDNDEQTPKDDEQAEHKNQPDQSANENGSRASGDTLMMV